MGMWVNALHGASSQFSPSDNAARQLLGAPTVHPKNASNPKTWSAVRGGPFDRVGARGLQEAVTDGGDGRGDIQPGTVVMIRGAATPRGKQAEDSDWFVLWEGAADWPADGAARLFAPPLRPGRRRAS